MARISDGIGYVASALVLLTFVMKEIRALRAVALLSNVAFVTFGLTHGIMPIVYLHSILFPVNVIRLRQTMRSSPIADREQQIHAAAPTMALRASSNDIKVCWIEDLGSGRWLVCLRHRPSVGFIVLTVEIQGFPDSFDSYLARSAPPVDNLPSVNLGAAEARGD